MQGVYETLLLLLLHGCQRCVIGGRSGLPGLVGAAAAAAGGTEHPWLARVVHIGVQEGTFMHTRARRPGLAPLGVTRRPVPAEHFVLIGMAVATVAVFAAWAVEPSYLIRFSGDARYVVGAAISLLLISAVSAYAVFVYAQERGTHSPWVPPRAVAGGLVLEHRSGTERPTAPVTTAMLAQDSGGAQGAERPLGGVGVPGPQVRRLLVEVNTRTWDDLTQLMAADDENASTVVNRAVQIYARLEEARTRGAAFVLAEPDGSTSQIRFA
jgi:hypothetical protein